MYMDINGLKKYFTVDANLKRLEAAPVIKSPILDTVYPEDKRTEYPSSFVKKTDLPSAIKNVPVVVRGTQAYEMPVTASGISGYEPFPVEMSKRIPAGELNDLQALSGESKELYFNRIIETMRKSSHATAEALAAQSLTGKIAYPVKGGDNGELYTVNFGQTKTHTVAKKFDASGANAADVIDEVSLLTDLVSVNGYGQNIVCLAGRKAFTALVKLLALSKTAITVTVSENSIVLPVCTVLRVNTSYYDYTSKTQVQSIPDKKICAFASDAPFWLPYCAIDDIGAGLAPLPFYSSMEEISNPSAIDIFAKSKPFPVPVVDCICWTDDVVSA